MYCSEMQMMFGNLVLVMCLVATIKLTFCSVGTEMSLSGKRDIACACVQKNEIGVGVFLHLYMYSYLQQ